MEKPNLLKLHLHQNLLYSQLISSEVQGCSNLYDELIKNLEVWPVGSDSLIVCDVTLTSDLLQVKGIKAVYRLPETENEPVFKLEVDTYLFYQLPYVYQNGKELMPSLTRFASEAAPPKGQTKSAYVRIYKETPKKVVVQFFTPIATEE